MKEGVVNKVLAGIMIKFFESLEKGQKSNIRFLLSFLEINLILNITKNKIEVDKIKYDVIIKLKLN